MGGTLPPSGVLLDWVTALVAREHIPAHVWPILDAWNHRIRRFDPATGAILWESAAWDSVRSDSHQVVSRWTGSGLWIQGSPARAIGNGCSVFGSGAAAALDLPGCLAAMVGVVDCELLADSDFKLSSLPYTAWEVKRVDVTGNLLLPNLEAVRRALSIVRGVEGGRYRVSNTAGDTVYFNSTSTLWSAKFYAKGPHLSHLAKKKVTTGTFIVVKK
jgi:II/X family phage/plasmid replication protein